VYKASSFKLFTGRKKQLAAKTGPVRPIKAMRNAAWIWFVGCAAWVCDAVLQLRLHALAHAELAAMVALVFLAAGFFYRQQKRP